MDRLRAFALDHRRPLAAACAALAVLTGLRALQPTGDVADLTVVSRDVPSGHVLTEDDLAAAAVPVDVHPDHVLPPDQVVGRRVAGPMRAGEAVTDRRVLSPRDLGDQALSMVRVEDPAGVVGLRVGDRVDVVATGREDGAEVVVRGATVAALPAPDDGVAATVGLTTSPDDALTLADVAVQGGVRLVVRS